MKKRILKYTIRVNKRQPSLIEIAIKDWPTYTQPFTFWSQREGHTSASNGYYYRETRPATEEEKKSFETFMQILLYFIGIPGLILTIIL